MSDPTIRLAGANLLVTVPSELEGRGHTVEIPCTEGGLRIIRKLLRKREIERDRRIATQASPTQQMVEEWLAIEARENAKKPLLPDLDLASIDLDL